MAGNPGSLTGRGRRPAIILAGLALALTSPAPAAERTATVLLVDHPRELVVFNKYQQRLGPDDAGRLPPFVPIVVLRERDLLGDGFTPCASVEIDREPYFLLRDAGGGLASHGDPGRSEILRDVTLYGDTVVLLAGKALRLRPAGEKGEIQLRPGIRVLRVFEYQSAAYVRLPSVPGKFGWVTLSAPSGPPQWREASQEARAGMAPGDLLQRVQPVVDDANRSLRRIYAALTSETGRDDSPPAFRLTRSRTEIRCGLEPAPLTPSYAVSTRALLAAVERVLGGTGLHAEITNGAILIPLR
jgi:hypothetical protein